MIFRMTAFIFRSVPICFNGIRNIRMITVLLVLVACMGTGIKDACPDDRSENPLARGQWYYQQGDYTNAALSWMHVIADPDRVKNTDAYLDAIVNISTALQYAGFHRQALNVLQNALPMMEKHHDSAKKAAFFNALSDLYLSMGDMEKSVDAMTRGLREARLATDGFLLARVLNNAGNIFMADGDVDSALTAYQESLDRIAGKDGFAEQVLRSKVQINLLRAGLYSMDHEKWMTMLKTAVHHLDQTAASYEKATGLMGLAQLMMEVRSEKQFISDQAFNYLDEPYLLNETYRALNESRQIALKIGNHRLISCCYGNLGHLYETEHRVKEALQFTRSAIFYGQQGNDPDILYQWQWQLGRVLKAMGNNEAAVDAYGNAIDTLNPIRQALYTGIRLPKDHFNRQIKPVYLGLSELLLEQAEATETGDLRQEKLIAARDVMEVLKTAELQDFFEDECATVMASNVTTLNQVPAHTAILYPIVLPDKLVMLLILNDGIREVQTAVDSETLNQTILRFRNRLQNRMNNRFLYDAEKLYDWIIKPIEQALSSRKVDTLIITPDGVLRLVPLSTLYDGRAFLIEKYAIGIIPAITLTDPASHIKNDSRVLLGGLSEARDGFSPLPSVEAELTDIQHIMAGEAATGNVVLKNKDFILDNLSSEIRKKNYGILHMATHGFFGGTPEDSFLLAYDQRITMDRLENLIRISRFSENPVELLTLSACQTALGDERAALGLAGVAVKAGVRSVVASLWYVDDEATSLAIREFFRQIKMPGMTKVKALQNAQKKLISEPRFWQPIYWAPFVIIGNWR